MGFTVPTLRVFLHLNSQPTGFSHSENLAQFWRKQKTANFLGISVRTLDLWMKSGVVSYFKIRGVILFRRSDVEAALEKLRIPARNER